MNKKMIDGCEDDGVYSYGLRPRSHLIDDLKELLYKNIRIDIRENDDEFLEKNYSSYKSKNHLMKRGEFMFKKIIRKNKELKIIRSNTVYGASNPGQIVLSKNKFIVLYPELKDFFYLRKINKLYYKEKGGIILQFSRYLYFGDCNPAIVISTDPLYVASYAKDIDCVALTMYPSSFRENYNLKVGSRLLSINMYGIWKQTQEDIIEGVEATHVWNAFRTLIGEFLSDDEDLINQKKQSIPEHIWKRCEELAFEYPKIMPNTYRSCNPFLNINPIIVNGVSKNPLHKIG